MSRPTTKGFFLPERLFEARKARDLTQREVAQKIGLEVSTLSKWETGQAAPEPGTIGHLATALSVYPSYFSKPLPSHGSTPIFFRSLANATKKARNREEARVRWLQDISIELQRYVSFPAVDIPDVMSGRHYSSLTTDDLEEIAITLRKHWGLGESPIDNVVLLVENAGVIVGLDYANSGSIDGQGTWSDVDIRPYMLLAKDKDNAYRRAMDCAHELSHIVLHKDVTDQELTDHFHVIEDQAKFLAGAFMLPHASFSNEIRSLSLDGFLELKARWGVSVGAMIMRAVQTEIIGEETAKRLWKYRSARGWHRKEPLDLPEETPVSNPRLLKRSIELVVDHKVRSKRDLLEQDFCLFAEDVETLCSIPRNYFAEPSAQIHHFQPTLKTTQSEPTPANVVPFRKT